jgi:hypothetical protein
LPEFENPSELLLSGVSRRRKTADARRYSSMLGRPYDYGCRGQVLAAAERLDVRVAWLLEDLELDFTGAEEARGTGFAGSARGFDTHGSVGRTRDDDPAFLELRLSGNYSTLFSYHDVECLEDASDRYGSPGAVWTPLRASTCATASRARGYVRCFRRERRVNR